MKQVAAEVQWLTDEEQATWRAFNLASRLVDGALDRQLLRDADMGHAHYAVLVTLSESADCEARMGDLADLLQYSPSRLSHAVRRMEANGWIERKTMPRRRPWANRRADRVGSSDDRAAPPPVTSTKCGASCSARSRQPNKNSFARSVKR